VLERPRLVLGEDDNLLGTFGEPLEHLLRRLNRVRTDWPGPVFRNDP
jgi:hypothetical protein